MPWDTEKVVEERALTLKEAVKLAQEQAKAPTIPANVTVEEDRDGMKYLTIHIPLDNIESDMRFTSQKLESGKLKITGKIGTIGMIPAGTCARVKDATTGTVTEYGVKNTNPLRITVALELRDGDEVAPADIPLPWRTTAGAAHATPGGMQA